MEQRPLPISANRLIDDAKAGIEKAYDALELLSKIAPQLAQNALKDNVKLQSATTTLQDALLVASDFISVPDLKNQPVTIEGVANPLTENDIETGSDEVLTLECDETFAIIMRYFRHRAGEPLAWEQLGDHLRKNNVLTPSDDELSDIVLEWQDDIEEAINSNETYPFKGRWIEFNGGWVFAEIVPAAQKTTSATPRRLPQVAPVAKQPIAAEQPAPLMTLHKEMETAPSVTDHIRSLMSVHNYARYNSLRNKLVSTFGVRDEAAANTILDTMIEDGELFSFRANGARHITFDQSIAEQLHTERVKRPRQTKGEIGELQFDNYEAAASVICAFLVPGRHIEQTMTYKDVSEETGYPVDIIKPAISYLKEQGYVSTALGILNRGGHRSASQQVLRIRLISQDVKESLKGMDRRQILEIITKQVSEIRELSTSSRQ